MIVIVNGPCGIGKTSVAWGLNARFDRAVMLDGDYGAVHPFEIYDKARVAYLFETIHHLIVFHIVAASSRSLIEHLAFRDVLRADADLRHEYQALKRALRTKHDRATYSERKGAFVHRVLAQRRLRSLESG
jgi:GrpB-like predicted nucleotidyltransferase (UPF0157 family)